MNPLYLFRLYLILIDLCLSFYSHIIPDNARFQTTLSTLNKLIRKTYQHSHCHHHCGSHISCFPSEKWFILSTHYLTYFFLCFKIKLMGAMICNWYFMKAYTRIRIYNCTSHRKIQGNLCLNYASSANRWHLLEKIPCIHYSYVIMGAIASQITSPAIVYATVYSCANQSKSKLRVTVLGAGNSPVTGEFPTQMASNAENVFIWWRHHVQFEAFQIAM